MLPPEGVQIVRALNQPNRARIGAPGIERLVRGLGVTEKVRTRRHKSEIVLSGGQSIEAPTEPGMIL